MAGGEVLGAVVADVDVLVDVDTHGGRCTLTEDEDAVAAVIEEVEDVAEILKRVISRPALALVAFSQETSGLP